MPRPVVVDCDPGVDDAIALAFFADAHHRGEIRLDAVTTVAGNVDAARTAHNAVFVLDRFGLGDVPVFAGSDRSWEASGEPVEARSVHGVAGLGSLDIASHPDRSVAANPEQLGELYLRAARAGATLVATGPLTNIARAIRARPGLVATTRHLVVMGGAFGSPPGNITDEAEFNFHCDAPAAHEVLASGIAVTVVPLDVTGQVVIGPDDLTGIADNDRGRLIRALFEWRIADPRRAGRAPGCVMHDALAAAVTLHPDLVATTRGTVALATGADAVGRSTLVAGDGPVEVALEVDAPAARTVILEALVALCDGDDRE